MVTSNVLFAGFVSVSAKRCRARGGKCSRRGTHIEIHRDDRSVASIHSTQLAGDCVAAGTACSRGRADRPKDEIQRQRSVLAAGP